MTERLFTPAEANKTLPLVKQIVADILERGREVRGLTKAEDDETVERSDRVNVLEAELNDLFRELQQIGCSYRDWGFELGLVDFPAKVGGKEVLLCWRSDEPAVQFFHAPEAGYAGRQPIPQGLLEVGRA